LSWAHETASCTSWTDVVWNSPRSNFDSNVSQGGAGTSTFTGGGFGGAIAVEGFGFFNFAAPTVFEVGEWHAPDGSPVPFFSMEFCLGGSLANRLGGRPRPSLEAAELVETLASAMQAAHESGVIHRDLKPAPISCRTHRRPFPVGFVYPCRRGRFRAPARSTRSTSNRCRTW
jgi:hypothetical protein